MTENEKLRELLEEARGAVKRSMGAWTWAGYEDHTTDEKALLDRIDDALAEPSEQEETEHAMHMRIRAGYDKTIADSWRAKVAEVEKERDEARAEIEFLRGVGCNELDGTDVRGPCGACLKCARRERDEARAMVGLLKDTNESDLRMLRATEAALDLTAVETEDLKRKAAAAYKRGAEAMQEAAAKACEAASWKRPDEYLAQECADDIRDLKIPEDK